MGAAVNRIIEFRSARSEYGVARGVWGARLIFVVSRIGTTVAEREESGR
jgi:hypothetical protein